MSNPVEYDVGYDGVRENSTPIGESAITGQCQGYGILPGIYDSAKELDALLQNFFRA